MVDTSTSTGDRAPSKWLALLALLVLVPAPSLGVLTAMSWMPGKVGQTIYGLCKLWLIILPVLWLFQVDRGRPSWSPPRHGGLGAGLLIGILFGSLTVGAFFLLGDRLIGAEDLQSFRMMAQKNNLHLPERYLTLTVFACTVNAALEEYTWRWFVFRKSEILMPTFAAGLLSALLFTLHHVFALGLQFSWRFTLVGSTGVFVSGLVWSWCYVRYRSIWPGYVSHAVIDIVVFALGWKLLSAGSGVGG